MNFGNVFIRLCSIGLLALFGGTLSYAQPNVPDNLMLKSDSSIDSYIIFIQKFKVCGDKTNRVNNPYPINDWLLSLSLKKQASVVAYLLRVYEYNCYEDSLNEMVDTLSENKNFKAIEVLKDEGWLAKPIYGQYSYTAPQDIKLNDNDLKALDLLLSLDYLPFDGIGMGELLRDFRGK